MKQSSFTRKLGRALAVVGLGFGASVPMLAHAAIDVTAATAGVSDAQTALLALLAAFIGLSAAIYGVVKVYGFLKRKSGA